MVWVWALLPEKALWTAFQRRLLNLYRNLFLGTENTQKSATTDISSPLTSENDATAAPQTSQKYVVIGASAGGGLLVLIIVAFVIKKIFCKARTSTQSNMSEQGAKVNQSFQGEFELHSMPVKMWEQYRTDLPYWWTSVNHKAVKSVISKRDSLLWVFWNC